MKFLKHVDCDIIVLSQNVSKLLYSILRCVAKNLGVTTPYSGIVNLPKPVVCSVKQELYFCLFVASIM